MVNIVGDYGGFFAAVGVLSLSYIALRALYTLWRGLKLYLLSPMIGLGVDVKCLGQWAVVTGATDGIGKAYAIELGRRGLNVVLISRSSEKLQAVAQEIESASSVKTKCVQIDFGDGLEIYDTISSELSGLEIGVLVNNVGVSYERPLYFLELESNKEVDKIIRVNCQSVTLMTRIVLPQMVERKKGAIINISSLSGGIPTPMLTVYSATKAYVDYFSRCLQAEYKNNGIIVQSVLPGFVATKMSKIRRASLPFPSPQAYVNCALATLGVAARTAGYSFHDLMFFIFHALPESLFQWATMKVLLNQAKRALRKQQKAQ